MTGLRNLWRRFWHWLLGHKTITTDNSTSVYSPAQSATPTHYDLPPSPPATTIPSINPSPTPIYEPELAMKGTDAPRYELWPSVLTPREREFFKLLLDVVGDRYQIFAKVRLGDIFKLGNEPQNRKYHSNQLQCKHFDFLLCEKDWYKPVLVIELDDNSHKRPDHQTRDEFKDQLCRQANLKLWRPVVQRTYTKNYIREEIQQRLLRN